MKALTLAFIAPAILSAGNSWAGPPTLSQAANPNVKLVIAGSAAAEPAFTTTIAVNLCGGASNMLWMTTQSGGPDFNAYSCVPPSGAGGLSSANGANVFTIYYRGEGGSAVAVYPVVNNIAIKRLNLSDASCSASGTSGTCTITGVRSSVALTDGWAGAIVEDKIQAGISDVEPAQFQNNNAPSGYTFLGPAPTRIQLNGVVKYELFQQTYGLFVNATGPLQGLTGLTKSAAANILEGNYVDWSTVPSGTSNAAVSQSSQAILLCNREPGAGSRAAASVFLVGNGSGCPAGSLQIMETSSPADSYSASDALACANANEGAITYATIDQASQVGPGSAYPNLTLMELNGISPSNFSSALGQYDWWLETTLNANLAAYDSNSQALVFFLVNQLQALASAPHRPQINALGNALPNTPQLPTPSHTIGSTTIYQGIYTRDGVSCSVPQETN